MLIRSVDACYSEKFVVSAALMPDAHLGYAAPIGAVLKTKGFVVPAWVGFDIGCGLIALRIKGRDLVRKVKEKQEEIDAEKMRQFYVALRRAKYRIYVPIAIDVNEKEIKEGSFSCMDYFLAHILQTNNIIPKDKLINKLDELREHITYSFIDTLCVGHENNLKEVFEIHSVKRFNKKFDSRNIYSFSSLNIEENNFLDDRRQEAVFPIGPEVGILFHKIFEKILNFKSYDEKIIRKIIKETIVNEKLSLYEERIFTIIVNAVNAPLLNINDFCLRDVLFEKMKVETEFLFSLRNDYLKGFIDLIFEHKDKYYIVDWKTNFLGTSLQDYEKENIEKQMCKHEYFLQAAIYTEGLKKYLKILKKDFQKSFGGVFYIFLRGFLYGQRQRIFHFYPDMKILDKIDIKQLNYISWKYE